MRRLVVIVLLALPGAAFAEPSLSGHPTLWLGSNDLGSGTYSTTVNLGVDARSGELAFGFSVEAFASVDVSDIIGKPGSTGVQVHDNSSFLRLGWRPPSWAQGDGLSLDLMPFRADRIYLGYEFPLVTPLGIAPSINQPWESQQGAVLRLARAGATAALSVRSQPVRDDKNHTDRSGLTAIASGSYDLLGQVLLEAQLAHSDLGNVVWFNDLAEWAGAARVTYHRGLPIGPLVDVSRYSADPAFWEEFLAPERYDDGLSLALLAEALDVATSGLADSSDPTLTTTLGSEGGALQGRLKWRTTRVELRGQLRSLSFLFVREPGYPPGYTLSSELQQASELTASAAVDHQFVAPRLTVGAGLEVKRPAYGHLFLGGESGSPVVVPSERSFEIQPVGGTVSPVLRTWADARWDLDHFSAVAQVFVLDDRNRTAFVEAPFPGHNVYAEPRSFGFNLLVQARFP